METIIFKLYYWLSF